MSKEDYEVIVIGGGSGGYAAGNFLQDAGIKVALIDGAEELGGLCILRGCMPSKSIIESAKRYAAIKEAAEFGITVGDASIDIKKVMDRKKVLIDDFKGYRQQQLTDGRFDLYRGTASFTDSHTVAIQMNDGSERILTAKAFVVASGSSVFIPEIDGMKEAGYLTSRDVLESNSLPKSISVLGGGAIALELAYFYAACDTEVTVIQRSEQILSTMDKDIADEAQAALEAAGIKFYCGTDIKKVSTKDGQKVVEFTHQGNTLTVSSDEILCALGRSPNTSKLGCDNAGLELKKGKLVVNLSMQTSQHHIYAAGDVCSPLDVVHLAIAQAEAAAQNILTQLKGEDISKPVTVDYSLSLYGIFTEPQIAAVGLSEGEAKNKGIDYATASYPFDDHGKSMVHGTKHGFVKLIIDKKSNKLIGGSVIGPEAVELIHEIVVAMSFGSTAEQLLNIPHYHPTLSEIWTYPAEDLAELST